MPHIDKTAFEPKNTNGVYNGLGNVTGLFRHFEGSAKVPDECPAGYLCMQDTLLPLDGYDSASNGNSWYFMPCWGTSVYGLPADRTGIYAANTYRAESVEDGDTRYNLGLNTLGIPIPELERGTFTELMLGEVYKFGEGNFASPPNEGDFVPIDGPIFGAGASDPPEEDGAVWGKVVRIEPFNDGPRCFGNGYCVKIFRNGQTGESPSPPTPPTPPTPPPEPVSDEEFIHFLEGSSNSITIPDGTKKIRTYSFYQAPFQTVTIPDTVTEISSSAFIRASLRSVYIPNSVRTIGLAAFSACSSIRTVEFENPAYWNLSLGVQIFNHAFSLTSVILPDSIDTIPEATFYNCSALPEITIPDNIRYIGQRAFHMCSSLSRVTLSSRLKTIEANAFSECVQLTQIELPSSLTVLDQSCFMGCTGLTSIVIPYGVTDLGNFAFSGCTAMTSATIPGSVSRIGSSAFSGCTSLTNVVLHPTLTGIGTNAFYQVPGPLLCRFPQGWVPGAPWGCTGEIVYNYD